MEQVSVRVLDLFQKFSQQQDEAKKGLNISIPSREKVLGLKYLSGDKVIDSVTGEEVEILGGNKYQYPTGRTVE